MLSFVQLLYSNDLNVRLILREPFEEWFSQDEEISPTTIRPKKSISNSSPLPRSPPNQSLSEFEKEERGNEGKRTY